MLTWLKTQNVLNIVNFLTQNGFLYETSGAYPIVQINENKHINDLLQSDLSTLENLLLFSVIDRDAKMQPFSSWNVYVDDNGNIITDIKLLERLNNVRKNRAQELDLPSYCIASNYILVQLATKKPSTMEEFLSIKGVGKQWYKNHGEIFLKEILDHLKDN